MIIPQEKRYKGPLGDFIYNSLDFELIYKYTAVGAVEVLKYRGAEVDGSKIVVPKGITDCSYMFERTSVKSAPMLPVSVRITNYMFKDCVSLEKGALLPYGVKSASFMYQGCRSLVHSPDLPDTVVNAQYMFDGCRSMRQPPAVSGNSKLENASGMFRNCLALESMCGFPAGIRNVSHAYRGCEKFEDALPLKSDDIGIGGLHVSDDIAEQIRKDFEED